MLRKRRTGEPTVIPKGARTEFLCGAGGCAYPYSLHNMKDLVDRFGVPLRPILREVPISNRARSEVPTKFKRVDPVLRYHGHK